MYSCTTSFKLEIVWEWHKTRKGVHLKNCMQVWWYV
jgi:hypothetical protein